MTALPGRSGGGWAGVAEVSMGRLRPWSSNPRRIAPSRLEDLQRSLADDPSMLWARPLIALPDGTVVCGNQRLAAARELGWSTIPVLFVDLDATRAKVWALRDNSAWGEWDEPLLAEVLAELNAGGIDLALTGFEGREVDRLLEGLMATEDPDEVPPLPAGAPDSRVGEIYQLGEHRLLCGDARDVAQVRRLLAGQQAALLVTDPPFGVSYVGKTKRALTIENDGADTLRALLDDAFAAVDQVLRESAPIYVFAPAGPQGTEFRLAFRAAGWRHHLTLVWVKDSFVLGHSDFHLQHEELIYGWTAGEGRPGRGRHRGTRWFGDNKQSSVLFAARPRVSRDHPTAKPVALLERLVGNSSRRGDVVLDPFGGSGSTLIACERLGRRCFTVEIDSAYADVIRRRYAEYVRDG